MKEIPLTQGKAALVDDDDYEYFNSFKWYAWKSGHTFYASRKLPRIGKYQGRVHMHREFFTDIPTTHQVDHINGNGLDNRRCNLRIVTTRQNQQNLHIQKSSEYYGITKNGNGWASYIRYHGRKRYLGFSKNEVDAHAVYIVAEKVLIGEE